MTQTTIVDPQVPIVEPKTGLITDVWWRYFRDPTFNTMNAVSSAIPIPVVLGITSGVSGGIPGFVSTTVMSSSPLLDQYALIIGGGAGATPYSLGTTGTSTRVLHGNSSTPYFSSVSLTADVAGILPQVNGGTGSSTGSITFNSVTATTIVASFGFVRVQGSVTTAPAVSPSAVHLWNTANIPIVSLINSSMAANSRNAFWTYDAAGLRGGFLSDAATTAINAIAIIGNNTLISSMAFAASTVNWNNPRHNSTHTFLSTVAVQGALNANGSANLGSSATFGLQVNATSVGWNNPTHNSTHTFASTVSIQGVGTISSHALMASTAAIMKNLALFGAGSFASATGAAFIADATVISTSNPAGGGLLYAEAGSLVWRGSSGTTTLIAAA